MLTRRGYLVLGLATSHGLALAAGLLAFRVWDPAPVLCACAPGTARTPPAVPFVPTPNEVVAEMLDFAGVTADDVVYDLGSGDGRIVIAAARDRGARAVGIEIDAELVARSRRNAAEAGVADRVEFREQDFFEADVRDATVVMLYLLPTVNRRLRPLLLEQLPPGARIVAHDFDMVDWPPHETRSVDGPERTHLLLRWTVPRGTP